MGFISSSLAVLVFLTMGPFQQGVAVLPLCPKGWEYINGYCYGFFIKPSPWHEAEYQCQDYSRNGHLVSVHSKEEAAAVAGLITAVKYYETAWIGLYTDSMGLWWWTDDSRYDYEAWAPGEPDYQGKSKFYCVQLYQTIKGRWKWDDTDCDIAKAFVCKHKP